MRSSLKILINGDFFSEEEAKISVFDHGLLYGDGVFEGIRFYNYKVFKLEDHIDRLYDSAKAINLDIKGSKKDLTDGVIKTISENKLKDGYVRLIVTRGVGTLGLSPFNCSKSSLIIIASTIELYPKDFYENGLKIVTCSTRRSNHDMISPAIKSLNYLSNVMAKIEAMEAGAQEGVMLNSSGYVSECTGDNIFIVKNDIIYTPGLDAGILHGITREVVIDLLIENGYKVVERNLTRYDLYTSDELFLTGTAAEIIPVREYDKRIIGNGYPGKITLKLMELYRLIVRK